MSSASNRQTVAPNMNRSKNFRLHHSRWHVYHKNPQDLKGSCQKSRFNLPGRSPEAVGRSAAHYFKRFTGQISLLDPNSYGVSVYFKSYGVSVFLGGVWKC